MKPTLNLRQIEAFRSVMLTGSVVGAARLMSVTQPGVSRTIGLMELRVGYPLFERRGRRLVPTPEAEALYREVERLYGSIERIGQVAEDIRFQRAGTLRVATLPALALGLVPTAITQFLASRPNVTVFVNSLPSREIAALVSTRQYDLGVIELPLTRPATEIEELEPVPNMVVMRADHLLARKNVISLKDLAGERMVLLSQHSYDRYQLDDAFSSMGIAPDVVIETPNSSVACALVASGFGITIVSRLVTSSFLGANLVMKPIAENLTSRFALIFPGLGGRLTLADAFAKELKELIRMTDADT